MPPHAQNPAWPHLGEPLSGKDWPKISVVVPSYNQAAYLETTLLSLIRQDYPSIEIILMDGGSTDGSLDIIKKYESHLAHWQSKPDKGQTDALNQGFARATGSILTWLNSDDWLAPHALRKMATAPRVAETASLSTPALYIGCGLQVDADGKVVERFLPLDTEAVRHDLRFTYPILQPATFFNRAMWETCGPLDTDHHWSFDWEFWLRALRHQALFISVPEFIAYASFHEEQKTGTGGARRIGEITAVLTEAFGDDPRYLRLLAYARSCSPLPGGIRSPALRYFLIRTLAHFGARWHGFPKRDVQHLLYVIALSAP